MSNAYALVQEIAAKLNERDSVGDVKWTAAEGHMVSGGAAHLHGPCGEDVYVRVMDSGYATANERGKVRFYGSTPDDADRDDWPYDADHPEIMVSESRGADVMAREVVRRLLPGYRDVLIKTYAAKRRREAAYAARTALTARIVAALGDKGRERFDQGRGIDAEWNVPRHEVSGPFLSTFKASHGGDSANIETHGMPADLVVRIAETMAEYAREHGDR